MKGEPIQQGFFIEETKSTNEPDPFAPLADRVRPRTLEQIAGQTHILGPDKPLTRMIEWDRLASLLLYGPPGTGKTTIAMVIAEETKMAFEKLSAVGAGIQDIRDVVTRAEQRRASLSVRTVLFIDEIHRFNKTQQDALLPHVEKGLVILIGATTENPFFSVNKALLSRCQVLELKPLTHAEIRRVLQRALEQDAHLRQLKPAVTEEALDYFAQIAGGDARGALGAMESAVLSAPRADGRITVDLAHAKEALQVASATYDRDGDQHYNTISAFIKSVRGSDPQAALYYLARMIAAGEDPRFIARRLIILAAEDIGLADPHALPLATATHAAVEAIGMPEGRIPLAECTVYLAGAPKSNSAYTAIDEALAFIKAHPQEDIPAHLKDTHYQGAKTLGHGQGYRYPHNSPDGILPQEYLPKMYADFAPYVPKENGAEARLAAYLRTVQKRSEETQS